MIYGRLATVVVEVYVFSYLEHPPFATAQRLGHVRPLLPLGGRLYATVPRVTVPALTTSPALQVRVLLTETPLRR